MGVKVKGGVRKLCQILQHYIRSKRGDIEWRNKGDRKIRDGGRGGGGNVHLTLDRQ